MFVEDMLEVARKRLVTIADNAKLNWPPFRPDTQA